MSYLYRLYYSGAKNESASETKTNESIIDIEGSYEPTVTMSNVASSVTNLLDFVLTKFLLCIYFFNILCYNRYIVKKIIGKEVFL